MFLSTKLRVTHVLPDNYGVTWASFGAAVVSAEGSYDRIQALMCRGNLLVGITNSNNDLLYSSNHGTSWTKDSASYQAAQGGWAMAVGYGSGPDKFVSCDWASNWAYSSNGTTWANGGTFTGVIYGIRYGNSIFTAVGSAGTCYTSTTGTSWTANSALNTAWSGTDWFVALYNGSVWCVVGSVGVFDGVRCCTASDPSSTWTQRTDLQSKTSTYSGNISMEVLGSTFVVLAGNHILTSTDGITWTDQGALGNLHYSQQGYMVSKGDKILLCGINAANNNNVAYTSTNGTSWTEQTGYDAAAWNVSGPIGPVVLGWDGTRFIIGGATDGSTYLNSLYSPA